MLLVMGALRPGFMASFLARPVIGGFVTASGILTAASQIRHIPGMPGGGQTLPETLAALARDIGQIRRVMRL